MDCNYYFLSSTALKIWQADDTESQNMMLACLSAVHKESYFSKVIYKRFNFSGSVYRDFSESAFLITWEAFNRNGKAGKIAFKDSKYTGYFFSAFKNNYLKLLERDIRNKHAEEEFKEMHPDENEPNIENETFFSPRTQKALDKISTGCKELLIWKHVENLTHDEIARRRNIKRENSIKMVSRCGKRFLKNWRTGIK